MLNEHYPKTALLPWPSLSHDTCGVDFNDPVMAAAFADTSTRISRPPPPNWSLNLFPALLLPNFSPVPLRLEQQQQAQPAAPAEQAPVEVATKGAEEEKKQEAEKKSEPAKKVCDASRSPLPSRNNTNPILCCSIKQDPSVVGKRGVVG